MMNNKIIVGIKTVVWSLWRRQHQNISSNIITEIADYSHLNFFLKLLLFQKDIFWSHQLAPLFLMRLFDPLIHDSLYDHCHINLPEIAKLFCDWILMIPNVDDGYYNIPWYKKLSLFILTFFFLISFTGQCCLFGNVSFGKRLSSVISPESRLLTRLWNFHNLKEKNNIKSLLKYH